MSFEQGQKVIFTTMWGSEEEATIVAVLPEGSKYGYAVEYTDADDGERVADFADEDDLEAKPVSLTFDKAALRELKSILLVAKADHQDKWGVDCSCNQRIDSLMEIVEKALGEA